MTDLATRIEQAGPKQQREMLKEAWIRIHHGDGAADTPHNTEFLDDPECRRCDAFWSLLNIGTDEAFTGAALMLVEGGHSYELTKIETPPTGAEMFIWNMNELGEGDRGEAVTPALAIAAACVRAHDKENG